ncbi:MAG: hypothetical protein A3F31_00220 [Candidatus Levybacteria bacterium RIFCSPHIGHO2_12_FULL_38_12]|nr:MAG: hypothetical protein A2770_02735 [Candidatus Levybacteria bacterium RIFCSPHIGHO2_01_FULL_38_12]OGH22893.1 MAG: hypothetical protein A3F31_00220 [Candidatus Levybacteria bacterium RIFCSPHIGHO2_12_FULL_38_12]
MNLKELPSCINANDQEEVDYQKLPNSDHELEKYFHSLANTIRASFNDYAFTIVTDRKQSIRIPTLEDIISLFGLEKGVSWQTNTGGFEGFDKTGRRLMDGNLTKEGGYATKTSRIDSLDSWTRKTYGTSSKAVFRKYAPDGSEWEFVLAYEEPIEPGEEFSYNYIHYVNSEGKGVETSYQGSMVRKTKFLSYCDKAENSIIYYHEPFFQRGKENLKKAEVEQAYNLREALLTATKGFEDSGLLTFLEQEEKESSGAYNMLKANLGLDKLPWYKQPSVLDILRVDELARFLESRFREVNSSNEISYKDYGERITGFRNQLWLLFRQFSPYTQSPQTVQQSYRGVTEQWIEPRRELYPKGLGPFDPGPHNPSAPNDPRGPDPRGPSAIDPRGPR